MASSENGRWKSVRLFLFFSFIFFSPAVMLFAQVQVVETEGDTNENVNNKLICSVTYETGGTFYTQSSSGAAPSFTDPDTVPVYIYKITYSPSGDCSTDTQDIFPERNDADVTNINSTLDDGDSTPASNEVGVVLPDDFIEYDTAPAPDTFIENLENVLSVPNVREYWTVNGGALPVTGFVDFLEMRLLDEITGDPTFFDPDELLLITERNGNSPMEFFALDQNGTVISGSNSIQVIAQSTGDYQWNTTVTVDTQYDSNGAQEQYLTLFEAALFGTSEDIYGFDINLKSSFADGSILGFRNPGTLLLNGECWRMLSSSPFQNTSFSEILAPVWTQGITNADTQFGEPNALIWDTAVADTVGGWIAPDDLNNIVTAGTGFLVGIYADDDFDGDNDGFPKELSVSGIENTGTITPALNTNSSGWTLVGNPFGAPVDFSRVTANSGTGNLTNVAYVYDRNFGGTGGNDAPDNNNTGGWRATSVSVGGFDYGDIPNGLIAPFQGFFVQNGGTGATIAFEENDRSSLTFDPDITNNPDEWQFFGKEQNQKEDFIRLEIHGNNLYNSAWIVLSEHGSLDRLNGDALELLPFSENRVLLSTRKGDELFDISQFPMNSDVQIPVHVEATIPGKYQLKITHIGISSGSKLVFTDTQENISLPLDENFEYEFEVRQAVKANPDPLTCRADGRELSSKFKPKKAKAKGTERFVIQHESAVIRNDADEIPSEIQLNQNYPNPFNPTTQISYHLPQQSEVLLDVYDLTGKLITTLVNKTVSAGIHTVSFDASNISSGIYMYRLQVGKRVFSRKFTVIK